MILIPSTHGELVNRWALLSLWRDESEANGEDAPIECRVQLDYCLDIIYLTLDTVIDKKDIPSFEKHKETILELSRSLKQTDDPTLQVDIIKRRAEVMTKINKLAKDTAPILETCTY